MNNSAGFVLIAIGVLFDLIGCLGLIRLPDVYNRLQGSTKCVALGTCCILLGTLFIVGFGAAGLKTLLCLVFVLLVSPVTAHALARSAHRNGVELGKGSIVDHYAEDKKKEENQ
jgi:multicomponent Na+:H+ antiporter subunit G